MLRLELLKSFECVNALESRILEAEYLNWLVNEVAKCTQSLTLARQQLVNGTQHNFNLRNRTQATVKSLTDASLKLQADLNHALALFESQHINQ